MVETVGTRHSSSTLTSSFPSGVERRRRAGRTASDLQRMYELVCDLLEHYPGEVLRYVILSAHYRSEQQFNASLLESAKRSLDTLYRCLQSTESLDNIVVDLSTNNGFLALLDDLNTSESISELHALARQTKQGPKKKRVMARGKLLSLANMLGLLQQKPDDWFKKAHDPDALSQQEIEEAILLRQRPRTSASGGQIWMAPQYFGAGQVDKQLKSSFNSAVPIPNNHILEISHKCQL